MADVSGIPAGKDPSKSPLDLLASDETAALTRLGLLQVPDPRRDERKAETEYPIMVLYDVRLAISLTL